MRLLHTSDWHLGRTLLGAGLLDHQRQVIDRIIAIAVEHEVDALIVAGDVYDRAVPPVDAVHLFQDSLVRLTEHCPVILLSGNHDSPTRLGFAGPLLAQARVHMATTLDDMVRPVEIIGRDGATVHVHAIPYLEPDLHRDALGADRSHASVLQAAMDRVREALARAGGVRSVVTAHAFITGSDGGMTVSDSERDLSVGGIGDAPARIFDGVDYVALGHLHGAQRVRLGDSETILRYSGSPLAYSFSEEAQTKSVVIVDIPAEGAISTDVVPLPVPRPLATLRGTLAMLLDDSELAVHADHWVRVVLTDERRPEDAMNRLRQRFPHTLELRFVPERDGVPVVVGGRVVDPRGTDALTVATSFIEHVTGSEATPGETDVVRASLERSRVVAGA
jgi:DNA repair protein SbcD/Mre11